MRISQLDGRRVALLGWGREGHAAYAAVRASLPALPLTLFCTGDEAEAAAALADPALTIATEATAERLGEFDVVLKSPGISPYRAEAVAAAAGGTRFIGGTHLWFAGRAGADGIVPGAVCVTGTKGKSTTTALLAHLLRSGGVRTALAGNIGLPLLELPGFEAGAEAEAPRVWAIELSSYQTGDVADSGARPDVAVVLNVFPEHLDWHGSQARYAEDKLRLVTQARPRIAVLNADDPRLAALSLPDSEVRWFGARDGWHLRGDRLYRGDRAVMDTTALPLPGRHNRGNLCAVLTVLEALGLDAVALAPHAASFQPLPHRLQTLGVRDGLTWVNDSISTTPHASLAALDCFAGRRVAILVGGHDRGVDWTVFADALRGCALAPMGDATDATGGDRGNPGDAIGSGPAALAVVTMGANGPRIHELLRGYAGFALSAAADLPEAIAQARAALDGEGVVLLSPGAPSFGPYGDYVARGRHFAALAGFDPDRISTIPGLGIA